MDGRPRGKVTQGQRGSGVDVNDGVLASNPDGKQPSIETMEGYDVIC